MGYSGRKKEVSKSINLCWRNILSGIIIAVFCDCDMPWQYGNGTK